MNCFVINKHGEVLMPCSSRKARILLREKKAKILDYKPFAIQLIHGSAGYTQESNLGIDTGSKKVGIAATSKNKVLFKGEIELRQDITCLLEKRKILRRSRRNRKTRYRKSRFLNRTRPSGWLPPSIQSRVNSTTLWINKFYSLLPKCKLTIEVGKFDIQKIDNPEIHGTEYQQGGLYQYRNRIAYLLAREKGKCQLCGNRYLENNGWRIHHIWGKSKNRTKDLALLHEKCHKEMHAKHLEKKLQKKKSKSFKESTLMNVIRKRLFTNFPFAKFTYGNVTFQDRCDLDLVKTHYNDAIAISGIKEIEENKDSLFIIKQFRKKKRSLHEVTARKGRKNKNITSKRNAKNTKDCKGFFLNDKVKVFGKVGFISGFSGISCYAKDLFGKYITIPGKSYKSINLSQVKKSEHNNNWQFIPHLKEGDFLPGTG